MTLRRDGIIAFLDGIEALRQKHFPRNWKYAHTFHDASCYLAFFAPEQNYIFRAHYAKLMAQYIGFEKPMGQGWYVDLAAYYEMCDVIVAALKEHPSLLEKHAAYLNDRCYCDSSLHLMAFDLIYCCGCYQYYHGLQAYHSLRPSVTKALKAKQQAEERRASIEQSLVSLNQQLMEAESQLAALEWVSLVGTVVDTAKYGSGVVIWHEENNKITVRFDSFEQAFKIHRKYAQKPTFQDDEDVVALLSDREDLLDKIKAINRQIAREQARLEA